MNVNPRVLGAEAWEPSRLEILLKRLPLGGEIDAPYLALHGESDIEYVDGNHRTVAAITLDLQSIKILVSMRDADKIVKILRLRERVLKTEIARSS